jgi:PKD repeat protein
MTEYSLGFDLAAAKLAVDNMRAFDNGGVTCPFSGTLGQRWKCGSSNPGGALLRAGWELTSGVPGEPDYDPGKIRKNALWTTVFLSSGDMNATDNYVSADFDSATWGFCPYKNLADLNSKDYPPTCRDQRWSVHHAAPAMGDTAYPLYDAEDYAYDNASYMGKAVTDPNNPNSLGVLIYAIALGQKAVCLTGQTYSPGPPVLCANWTSGWEDLDSGKPNTGELFLRYTAAVGDDGNPNTDPCLGLASGYNCGNYYFAPDGSSVGPIMLDVASRIYTATLPPVADFSASPLSGTAPLTVTFTNQSTGGYKSVRWDFGDGVTSTLNNPTHTYTVGSYTVTLEVTGPSGTDVTTRTNYITVYTPIAASFSASPLTGIVPLTVTFVNQSTGDYTDTLWNFGDGGTATDIQPTHTYTVAGSYTVALTVSNALSTSTVSRTNYITVYTPVAASFSASPLSGTAPLTVTFVNQSTGDYDSVWWDFGDGMTSTLSNPTHIYAVGAYTVSLQVTGLGGTDIVTRTNYIDVSAPQWRIYLPLLQKSP